MVLARWRWAECEREQAVFFMAAGAGILLAGIAEVIQFCVPDRSFCMNDFAANFLEILWGH